MYTVQKAWKDITQQAPARADIRYIFTFLTII